MLACIAGSDMLSIAMVISLAPPPACIRYTALPRYSLLDSIVSNFQQFKTPLQWDVLDITCGLAGWRLVSAAAQDSPDGGEGAQLSFRLAGSLATLSATLWPADSAEGAP